MSQVLTRDGSYDVKSLWARRPEFFAVLLDNYVKVLRLTDPVLTELCRLRVAQLLESPFDLSIRYRPALNAGLTNEQIAALADYSESDLFTPKQKAVLEYADLFVVDASVITDEQVDRVKEHMDPVEFMYTTKVIGVCDRLARIGSAFRLAPATTVPDVLSDFDLAEN